MGIYDRGYMTEGEESAGYAGRRYSDVIVLMVINLLVWVAWQFSRDNLSLHQFMHSHFLLKPATVVHYFQIHTLVTAAFSHIGIGHFFFNMLFFWYLGEDVERIYGYRNTYWLYIFTALGASLAFVGLDALKTSGQFGSSAMLGASGAVMGVAVVAAFFDPNKPIAFMGFIPMKLKWLVALYIGFDLLSLGGSADKFERTITGAGAIAHIAHLGGALAGLLFYKLDLRMFGSPGREKAGFWNRIRKIFRKKPRLRRVERRQPEEVAAEAVATRRHSSRAAAQHAPLNSRVDPATSERVDELLVKISRQGMDSLTEEERQFLKHSSEKYKKK